MTFLLSAPRSSPLTLLRTAVLPGTVTDLETQPGKRGPHLESPSRSPRWSGRNEQHRGSNKKSEIASGRGERPKDNHSHPPG